ncbi:MAG: EsaB/YukD family protein [Ignavibacteria bacterium]|nr:EsaB/YukD family protein [Ignavibacteria bacterium]
MAKINVTIIDATGNKQQEALLPDNAPIKKIMEVLLPKMKMPLTGPDGDPLSYKFHHKASGKQLTETQTLSEAGVKDGDVLRLFPEITAGSIHR